MATTADRANVIDYLKSLRGRTSDCPLHQRETTAHFAAPVIDLVTTVDFFIEVFDTPVGRVDEQHGLWCDLRFGPFQLVPHQADTAVRPAATPVDGKSSPIPHLGLLFYDEASFRSVVEQVERSPRATWYEGTAPTRRWSGMLGEQETGFLQVPGENLWIELKWFIHGQRAAFAADLSTPVG